MKNRSGYTLVELLVAVIIAGIMITITASIYGLFRKSISRDQAKAEISQNARDLRLAGSDFGTLPQTRSVVFGISVGI